MALNISFYTRSNHLKENGYNKDTEVVIYEEQLKDIYENVRWYLDNLTYLHEYRVRWKDYRNKNPPVPYKFI